MRALLSRFHASQRRTATNSGRQSSLPLVTFRRTIVSMQKRRVSERGQPPRAAKPPLSCTFSAIPMLILLLVALLLFPATGHAQQVDKSFYYDYGEKFYYDIVNIPDERSDSTRFQVFFRIRQDVLLFTNVGTRYVAQPLLYVEFIDSTGIIRVSREWRDTVIAGSYELTQSKKEFVQGAMTVDLPPGVYTVVFELGDKNAPRTNRFRVPGMTGRDFTMSPVIGQPLFVAPADGDTYRPFILKGNISFPSRMSALISVSGALPSDDYVYTIEQAKNTKDLQPDDPVMDFTSVSGSVRPEMKLVPAIASDASSAVLVQKAYLSGAELEPAHARTSKAAAPDMGLLEIVLPEDKMSSGKYVLKVYKRGGTDTLTHPFSLIWENKPLSLRNIQYAVELAYYIMTDEEYDAVNSGSLEAKRQKLYTFWKNRDPQPASVFNEAMAEYYSRVDYAFFNYQTLAERDGARTERGKIYVLHGAPTNIDRRFEPDTPVLEVWRYDNNVRKEFIFESSVPGVFHLKTIKDM